MTDKDESSARRFSEDKVRQAVNKLQLRKALLVLVMGISQGGHSGTEGGRTFITYFAEEGVFF